LRRDRVGAFLSIVLSGQLVYAAFEALKGSLMLQVSDVLGIGVDGFGAMMSVVGLAMYMYIPAGWINNRFTIRAILVTWCAWRLVALLVLDLIPGLSFTTCSPSRSPGRSGMPSGGRRWSMASPSSPETIAAAAEAWSWASSRRSDAAWSSSWP
jgi:MFS transporter